MKITQVKNGPDGPVTNPIDASTFRHLAHQFNDGDIAVREFLLSLSELFPDAKIAINFDGNGSLFIITMSDGGIIRLEGLSNTKLTQVSSYLSEFNDIPGLDFVSIVVAENGNIVLVDLDSDLLDQDLDEELTGGAGDDALLFGSESVFSDSLFPGPGSKPDPKPGPDPGPDPDPDSNNAPVAAADTAAINEDVDAVFANAANGVLKNDTDVDASDTHTVSHVGGASANVGNSHDGTYGSVNIASDGSYTYTLNNNHASVQALAVGETLTDQFAYTVSDGNGGTSSSTLTVTINGANDAHVVVADTAGINEDTATVSADAASGVLSKIRTLIPAIRIR